MSKLPQLKLEYHNCDEFRAQIKNQLGPKVLEKIEDIFIYGDDIWPEMEDFGYQIWGNFYDCVKESDE